jgi:hypothetical protein
MLLRTFHVANEHNGDGVEYTKRDGKKGYYSSSGKRRKAEGVKPGIFDLLEPRGVPRVFRARYRDEGSGQGTHR